MDQQSMQDDILKDISMVGGWNTNYDPEGIIALGKHLEEYILAYRNNYEELKLLWNHIFEISTSDIFGKIMALFELLEYMGNGSCTDAFLQEINHYSGLGWRNQLYILKQIQSLLFTKTITNGVLTSGLCWQIYEMCLDEFCQEVKEVKWIPQEERNENFVIVTTSQFLSEQHAPTKTALDRCVVLMQSGKNVLLVNTAEQGADVGNILLFHRMQTNYKKILSRKDHITFHGVKIPFFQCGEHMPNVLETNQLIDLVFQDRPSYIVNIGGESLVTDILSKMVPVLTVATVFSSLVMTKSQFQMIGRPLRENDIAILQQRGQTVDQVITGKFTFSLKEQTQKLSRDHLGIPLDRFALIVVGARLEREVTDEFIEMLLSTVELGAFLVFVGKFDFEFRIRKHPGLNGNAVYLGFQSDILAIMEQVDLYVNPGRSGGGSSVVEAMYKGIVPVTLPFGDVYVNTGDAFAVEDYDQMKEEIGHYIKDHAYYVRKSELARKKAAGLMDSKSAFLDVIHEFESRIADRERYLMEKSDFVKSGSTKIFLSQKSRIDVDVLVAVAEKGGVENVIKMMIDTLESDRIHFRVVQMVWEGYLWVDDSVEFVPLLEGKRGHNLQEFIDAYDSYLKKDEKYPDIMLAAGWPYLCSVARAVNEINKINAPVVSWIHSEVKWYDRAGYGGWEQLGEADAHFVINSTIQQQFIEHFPQSMIFRSFNPVEFPDQREFEQIAKKHILSYKLLYVGRVSVEKNLELVFRVLQKVKRWNLYIIGSGEDENRLKRLADEMHIEEQIHWYGWHDKPWEYVAQLFWDQKNYRWKIDALIQPSVYEGGPLTAIEAWCRGLPVISTPVGFVTECIREGKNGFLFENGDDESCVHVLQTLSAQEYLSVDVHSCIDAALPFERRRAFQDMEEKLWKLKTENDIYIKKQKKISIIVPCYNVADYLKDSSIIDQTIGLDDMEIIFVDDASTDDTLSILKFWQQRFPGSVKVIHLEKNGRQGAARNVGISHASGEYIGFVDADDKIHPKMYEQMIKKAEETKSDLVSSFVCYSHNEEQQAKGRFLPENQDIVFQIDNLSKRKYLLAGGMGIYGTVNVISKIYKRDFLERYRIRFGINFAFEDLYFSDMVSFYVNRFCVMQAEYYTYFEHSGSTMTSMDCRKWMEQRSIMLEWVKECEKRGLMAEFEEEIAFIFARDYYVSNLHHAFLSEEEDISEVVWHSMQVLKDAFPDIQNNQYIRQDGEEYLYDYQKVLFVFLEKTVSKGKIQVLRRKYQRDILKRHQEELDSQ